MLAALTPTAWLIASVVYLFLVPPVNASKATVWASKAFLALTFTVALPLALEDTMLPPAAATPMPSRAIISSFITAAFSAVILSSAETTLPSTSLLAVKLFSLPIVLSMPSSMVTSVLSSPSRTMRPATMPLTFMPKALLLIWVWLRA